MDIASILSDGFRSASLMRRFELDAASFKHQLLLQHGSIDRDDAIRCRTIDDVTNIDPTKTTSYADRFYPQVQSTGIDRGDDDVDDDDSCCGDQDLLSSTGNSDVCAADDATSGTQRSPTAGRRRRRRRRSLASRNLDEAELQLLRQKINGRERQRMHDLNSALDGLREVRLDCCNVLLYLLQVR